VLQEVVREVLASRWPSWDLNGLRRGAEESEKGNSGGRRGSRSRPGTSARWPRQEGSKELVAIRTSLTHQKHFPMIKVGLYSFLKDKATNFNKPSRSGQGMEI
jgi:hypothetical protein